MSEIEEIDRDHITIEANGLKIKRTFRPQKYATYLEARSAIETIKDSIGFGNLTTLQQEIVARWNLITDQPTLNSLMSAEEQQEILDFHERNEYGAVELIKVGDVIKRKVSAGNPITILGSQSNEIHISKETQGHYSSISAAIAAHNNPNNVYIVHPGLYIENNPLVLPIGAVLNATGTPGNTTIVAMNPNAHLIICNPWNKIEGFTLANANGAGSAAIYFDGSIDGNGSFVSIEECIIRNCDVGMCTINGPDTLIATRSLITPTVAHTSSGVCAMNGGQFISSSLSVSGVPGYFAINRAIESIGAGSKVSMTTTSAWFCNHGVYIDDNGEIEATLLTLRYDVNAMTIGPTGTKSKVRATGLRALNSIQYDIEVQATDVDVTLTSSEYDESKIFNPNEAKLQSAYYSTKNDNSTQVLTGEVHIGTIEAPTKLIVGEGQYNIDNFIVLTNTNEEVGSWNDISEPAKSLSGSTAPLFAGPTVGNCVYIGAGKIPRGVKIYITSAVGDVSSLDTVSEYWDGNQWKSFSFMCTSAETPFNTIITPFVNTVGKYQLRFGVNSNTESVIKTLNGFEKYWMRWRIVNDWSSIPEIEYIKLHTNSTEINKDGFQEYFGDARPVGKLDWDISLTKPVNSSPTDQDVFLSDKLGVGRVKNCLQNNTTDRLGLNEFLPMDMDTSFPIKIKFSIVGSSNVAGDVHLVARWNFSNNGSSIYRTTATAPSSSTNEKEYSTVVTISANDTEHRGELQIDCSSANICPADNIPDMLWVSIERDATGGNATDTYEGDISFNQIGVYYIKWRDGGHLLSY